MTKKEEDNLTITIMVGMISIVIGIFIGLIMANTDNIAMVKENVLDKACQKIYGEEYIYIDTETGTNTELVCTKPKPEIPKEPEEPKQIIREI